MEFPIKNVEESSSCINCWEGEYCTFYVIWYNSSILLLSYKEVSKHWVPRRIFFIKNWGIYCCCTFIFVPGTPACTSPPRPLSRSARRTLAGCSRRRRPRWGRCTARRARRGCTWTRKKCVIQTLAIKLNTRSCTYNNIIDRSRVGLSTSKSSSDQRRFAMPSSWCSLYRDYFLSSDPFVK